MRKGHCRTAKKKRMQIHQRRKKAPLTQQVWCEDLQQCADLIHAAKLIPRSKIGSRASRSQMTTLYCIALMPHCIALMPQMPPHQMHLHVLSLRLLTTNGLNFQQSVLAAQVARVLSFCFLICRIVRPECVRVCSHHMFVFACLDTPLQIYYSKIADHTKL